MKQHTISREGALCANNCIKKCNNLIFICQKLRTIYEIKDVEAFAAELPLCVQRCHECVEACSAWTTYCQEHREECHDQDCNIMYGDALAKSDECIKACGNVIQELTKDSVLPHCVDACIECVEIADECIEECASILKKHL